MGVLETKLHSRVVFTAEIDRTKGGAPLFNIYLLFDRFLFGLRPVLIFYKAAPGT
jgi:hypothetical protein